MARIRTIKPEMFQDEKLAPLAPITRFVFVGLIAMADDAGRLLDNAKVIDAFVFPDTEDSCRAAIGSLADAGVIRRGLTSSGQRVIQIVNWSRHQKIDKPNFSSALPPIDGGDTHLDSFDDSSPTGRRKIPDAIRALVWERDGGRCCECSVECKRAKANRYDSDPTLGHIDHRVALADGGSNDIENLQLLCLGCNCKKAGEAVRRRNWDASSNDSANNRRSVAEASAPHISTNDLRPSSSSSGSVASLDVENPVGSDVDNSAESATTFVWVDVVNRFLATLAPGRAEKVRARMCDWLAGRGLGGDVVATMGDLERACGEWLELYPQKAPSPSQLQGFVESAVRRRLESRAVANVRPGPVFSAASSAFWERVLSALRRGPFQQLPHAEFAKWEWQVIGVAGGLAAIAGRDARSEGRIRHTFSRAFDAMAPVESFREAEVTS